MQKGLEVSRSQGNAKDARIEGINELMLQAKVHENLGRLEVVPEALALTKSTTSPDPRRIVPPNASKSLHARSVTPNASKGLHVPLAVTPLTPFMTVHPSPRRSKLRFVGAGDESEEERVEVGPRARAGWDTVGGNRRRRRRRLEGVPWAPRSVREGRSPTNGRGTPVCGVGCASLGSPRLPTPRRPGSPRGVAEVEFGPGRGSAGVAPGAIRGIPDGCASAEVTPAGRPVGSRRPPRGS